jgi:hypothetical protein
MVDKFYDQENGGFFYTSADHEELFGRTKQAFDQPMPSPNAIAIRCLLAVGDTDRARKSLESFTGWMERAPTATEALFVSAMDFLALEAELAPDTAVIEVVEAPAIAKPPAKEVEIKLSAREIVADSDGRGSGKVVIEVPEGFHINTSEPPARWLVPTKLDIRPVTGVVAYPPASNDRYEGRVEIPFTAELPNGESGADFEIVVTYQACTESECLLPQEKVLNAVVVKG